MPAITTVVTSCRRVFEIPHRLRIDLAEYYEFPRLTAFARIEATRAIDGKSGVLRPRCHSAEATAIALPVNTDGCIHTFVSLLFSNAS